MKACFDVFGSGSETFAPLCSMDDGGISGASTDISASAGATDTGMSFAGGYDPTTALDQAGVLGSAVAIGTGAAMSGAAGVVGGLGALGLDFFSGGPVSSAMAPGFENLVSGDPNATLGAFGTTTEAVAAGGYGGAGGINPDTGMPYGAFVPWQDVGGVGG